MKRAFTIFLPLCVAAAVVLFCAHHEWHPLSPNAKADRILVEKAARRLTLLHGRTALKTYRIALGRSPIGPKQQETDHRTPEGFYSIDSRNRDSTCYRGLHISYPNHSDVVQAARRGVAPGGDIMIHGIGNGYGWLGSLHRTIDWTSGCIGVTDEQIEEIWRAVPNGTPIEIRP